LRKKDNMQALIAGGAGFIGSYLCESLLEENFSVICVDNLITGNKDNISHLLKNTNFKFINEDISSINFKIEEKVDLIFHLASPASPNKNNKKSYINFPVETLLANSQGTYNLLEIARKNNAKFLYASSSEVYGDPQVSIQKENYFGNVNPNGIRSPYDEGKRFGEAMTMTFFRKHNVDARIIRIFNTYGPKMADDGRVVVSFIKQALEGKSITIYGKGDQTRSFCYITDQLDGIKKAMFKGNAGLVVNIGNPQEVRILEVAKMVKSMTNSNSDIVFEELPEDDPRIRKPDISLAKETLGWEPKIGIEEGLKLTIDYFKNL
jgi:dTDP-glucose 4,6-dehydratase